MTHIRRRITGQSTLQVERLIDPAKGWHPSSHLVALGYEAPYTAGWEARHAISYGGRPGVPVLPFQPLSVRHFYGSSEAVFETLYGQLTRLVPGPVESVMNIARDRLPLFPSAETDTAARPVYRLQNPLTVVPSQSPLRISDGFSTLDYEPRLGFLIAKELHHATVEEAEAAIGALVVVCEFGVTEDDGGPLALPVTPLSSLSEVAVSATELLSEWQDLVGTVTINDQTVFEAQIGHEVGIGNLLAVASNAERLLPGELFSIDAMDRAGSVASGSGRPLSSGDQLVVDVPGLGRIEHTVG